MASTGYENFVYRGERKFYTELTGRAEIRNAEAFLARDAFVIGGVGAPESGAAPIERAEFSAVDREIHGRDVWAAFAVRVIGPNPSDWCLINQFHDVPDKQDAVVPPPFGAELVPGGRGFRIMARAAGSRHHTAVDVERTVYEIDEFERDRWHHFVYHLVFERAKSGVIQIWHNGVSVADLVVPFGYNNEVGPYFKYGAYRAATSGATHTEYVNVELRNASLLPRVANPRSITPKVAW
ncbi:hypothetical protein N802_00210 [Knoellia sinensis KCTC 19936]|uniref:Uncharacterized protein n=1 Tax=Knoellia sinensis KCTC 19936 TaxID=1385520 RepID=A0A0A0JDW4_9MICO|nr:heparin lyase I family protein [Knoellia sinensis]KGN34974.1 hypothetical protein N802_00210 [Knoellia sinensis KCTC 19936]